MKNKILTKEEIIEKISKEKQLLSERFYITEIGLFGSFIRDDQKKNSDIDILIDYNKDIGISLFELAELKEYLSNLLGNKVDLALKKTLKKVIGKHILDEVVYI